MSVVLAAMAAMIFALMPAAPAAAGQGVVNVRGTAWLSNNYVGSGPGCFIGQAAGAHVANGPVTGPATATFNYSNPNQVQGNANGLLSLPGHANIPFTWIRVGATAIVTLGATAGHSVGGAAVAGFAPVANPTGEPNCGGYAFPAQVVGVGVYG